MELVGDDAGSLEVVHRSEEGAHLERPEVEERLGVVVGRLADRAEDVVVRVGERGLVCLGGLRRVEGAEAGADGAHASRERDVGRADGARVVVRQHLGERPAVDAGGRDLVRGHAPREHEGAEHDAHGERHEGEPLARDGLERDPGARGGGTKMHGVGQKKVALCIEEAKRRPRGARAPHVRPNLACKMIPWRTARLPMAASMEHERPTPSWSNNAAPEGRRSTSRC